MRPLFTHQDLFAVSLSLPLRRAHRLLAAGLLAVPAAWAQAPANPPPVQAADWRQANDAVGAYPRGHADVLRWELAQRPVAEPVADAVTSALALPTADAAVRQAWRAHPDLVRPLARLGEPTVARLAQGLWAGVDLGLQRRIEGVDAVLAVAVQARKAWTEAVAAQQRVRQQRQAVEATAAALELGQRMVTVGNWSALQAAPVQLAATGAGMDLRRAQYAAAQAQAALLQALGLAGVHDVVALPEGLPAVPAQALDDNELAARTQALLLQMTDAERPRQRALARLAAQAYRTAHALVQDSQEGLLRTRALITEETLLRHNGMLKSVWNLLDEVRNQSQAQAEAVGVQRDFWIAEADLQWVLQGGTPERLVNLGGAAPAEAAGAAAH